MDLIARSAACAVGYRIENVPVSPVTRVYCIAYIVGLLLFSVERNFCAAVNLAYAFICETVKRPKNELYNFCPRA